MPKYDISYSIDGYAHMTVEAETPEEAVAAAGTPPDWLEEMEWEIEISGFDSPETLELDAE